MDEKQIGELIEELKALKLRESVVISQLEAAHRRQIESGSFGPGAVRGTAESDAQDTGLSVGDRVYVTNKVRRPATWNNKVTWEAEKERRATVTRVTANQV